MATLSERQVSEIKIKSKTLFNLRKVGMITGEQNIIITPLYRLTSTLKFFILF